MKIQISDGIDYIVVSNIVQRENSLEESTQTGLSNLKKRVKLILGKELIVQEENEHFGVKLPVLNI